MIGSHVACRVIGEWFCSPCVLSRLPVYAWFPEQIRRTLLIVIVMYLSPGAPWSLRLFLCSPLILFKKHPQNGISCCILRRASDTFLSHSFHNKV